MEERKRGVRLVLLAAVLLLPLLIHHSAWRGWFEDDDLSTLTWAGKIPPKDLLLNIPSILYPPEHSRPTGFLYYDTISRRWGLEYPPYLAALQAICVLNVALLWLLLRRMGIEAVAAAAGCLFFACHRALFDAWWKPMFVYDVLCTTFALASILAWAYRRWVLSFIAFWLAMRSKEVGIVLPAVLLWYEMTLGRRNWKLVLPFFVPAVIYGIGGLIYNLHQQSAYTFHSDAAALGKSAKFYFDRLLGIHWVGLVFLLLPFVVRDRRIWFGVGALLLGLAIYLLLPGRLLDVYLYLAMTGAAIAVATLAARRPAIALAAMLVWTSWQYLMIRKHANRTLAEASERSAYVDALRLVPDTPIYIYDRIPGSMHSWGVDGALRLYHHGIVEVHRLEDAGLPVDGRMLLVDWDARARHLASEPFFPLAATYIAADGLTPAWQLLEGWHAAVDGYREIDTHARARLYRPPAAASFEWEACGDRAELRIHTAGEEVSRATLAGCEKRTVSLRPAEAGITGVEFFTQPAGRSVRIARFGFVTR
jgi:hypothetical protein